LHGEALWLIPSNFGLHSFSTFLLKYSCCKIWNGYDWQDMYTPMYPTTFSKSWEVDSPPLPTTLKIFTPQYTLLYQACVSFHYMYPWKAPYIIASSPHISYGIIKVVHFCPWQWKSFSGWASESYCIVLIDISYAK
jgi:hypothetical protein